MRHAACALLAPQLVVILGLVGCATTEAPAEVVAVPVAPTATAPLAHTGAISRSPRRSQDALFRGLPSECPEGRVYIQAEALLGVSGADALDALVAKVVAAFGVTRGERTQQVMRDVGLGVGAVREIAVCVGAKSAVFALRVRERSLHADLPDALAALFEALDIPTTREDRAEVTWVLGGEKVTAAVLGERGRGDVVVFAEKRDALDDALLVGGGAAAFVEARPYLVWIRTNEFNATLLPVRENYELAVLTPPPVRLKDKWATDPDGVVAALRADLEQTKKTMASSPLSPGLPILENMTIERAGDELLVHSTYLSSLMPDFFAGLGRASFADIQALLR